MTLNGMIGIVLALAVMSTACESTVVPSAPRTTNTFSGTLIGLQENVHTVTVRQTGDADVTLTSVGPPATKYVGLGIGVLSGSKCVGSRFDTVQVGAPPLTGAVMPGLVCITVFGTAYDPILDSLSYTIVVGHP